MDVVWSLAVVSLATAADLAMQDRHGLFTVSPATARWMRSSVAQLVAHLGRDIGVEELTPLQVSSWVQSEMARGLSAVSVNSRLRAIKTIYSRLQRNGVASSNPAAPVPFLAEPPARPKAIHVDDYLAMRGAANTARDRAILDVLWSSGCRLGGLVSMRIDRMEHWRQADGRACYALLVVEKFNRSRWVYVGREALQGEGLSEWLAERPLGAPWLWLSFSPPYGRIAAATVESTLRRLRLAAGIQGRPCNAHAFRHAFAVRMLDEGEDLAAVSAWLGHHSPEFTAAVYAIRPERALRDKYFSR